jgi:hypothetical protein
LKLFSGFCAQLRDGVAEGLAGVGEGSAFGGGGSGGMSAFVNRGSKSSRMAS